MKTVFCLSDVHGFFDEMIKALDDAGFDKENDSHIFIHCGDLLDRGKKPLECLKFVNSLPKDRKFLICGNHEDLLYDVFSRGDFAWNDIPNGTVGTVASLAGVKEEQMIYTPGMVYTSIVDCWNNKELRKYYDSLVDFAEVGDYIFVHGWIPLEEDWKNGDWKSARWYNGMSMWRYGNGLENKTIVCGHFHSSWGHHYLHKNGSEFDDDWYYGKKKECDAIFTPFVDNGIIALDACTAYSKFVNCYKIEIED